MRTICKSLTPFLIQRPIKEYVFLIHEKCLFLRTLCFPQMYCWSIFGNLHISACGHVETLWFSFSPKKVRFTVFFIYWTLQRKLLQKRETWAMSGEFRPVIFALISRKIPSILYIDTPVGPLPSQCPSIQGVEVSEVPPPPQIKIAAAWNFVSFKKLCFRIYSEEEEAGKTSLFLKVIEK